MKIEKGGFCESPPEKRATGIAFGSDPLVSFDELQMLLASEAVAPHTTKANGFKYRNCFLLLGAALFLLHLNFYSAVGNQFLNLPPTIEVLFPHLNTRIYIYIFLTILYCWSYANDWYFERVSLASFASEATVFLMDYVTIINYISGSITAPILFYILLRITFVTCLFINVAYACHAPLARR